MARRQKRDIKHTITDAIGVKDMPRNVTLKLGGGAGGGIVPVNATAAGALGLAASAAATGAGGTDTRTAWERGEAWYQANTGVQAGITLTKTGTPGGTIYTTANNQVIENLEIAGQLVIQHTGVVVRNCRFTGCTDTGGGAAITTTDTSSSLIEHVEIDGSGGQGAGYCNGIQWNGRYTGRFINIWGVWEDGMKLHPYTYLYDSYIHDMAPRTGAHPDAIQLDQCHDSEVHRCWIEDSTNPWGTSAVFIKPEVGPFSNVLVDSCYLSGGGFTMAFDMLNYGLSNFTITNNVWGNGIWEYGPVRVANGTVSNLVWTGNTLSTGATLGSPQ